MHRHLSLLFFLLLAALSTLIAQDEPSPQPSPNQRYPGNNIQRRDFDEKKWASLKEGIDYAGQKKKKKPTEKSAKKKAEKEVELPNSGIQGLGGVFKILGIILLVGLLVLLIVKMAGGEPLFGPKNSKLKPAVSQAEMDKIEENLQEAELTDPIQRAIAAGDYPLAVRLYYLAVLKELATKNHIRWKRDKTNGEYLRELAGSPLFATVQEVTLAFERVWYGKVELAKPDFDQLETKFKKAVATASASNQRT